MILPFVSRKKYDEIILKLECLLSYATGGRYSKATYTIADMERMVDDYLMDTIDKELVSQHEQIRGTVFCGDCKWSYDAGKGGFYCNHPDNLNPIACRPIDYCDEGERRKKRT